MLVIRRLHSRGEVSVRGFKTLLLILTVCLATLFAGAAFAGAATTSVQKTQNDLFEALKAGDDKKIDTLFGQFIDYDTFAQDSLGSEWAGRSAAEKVQFNELLKKLVGQAYKCNLKKIQGFNLTYGSEAPAGSATWVKSTATKGGDSVELNFKVANQGGTWKVQDIETEGVSLVSNNRSQFVKIIKDKGFPALIDKMKAKVGAACPT
jgi:phospholipid transport system substrate-binding protein